MFEIDVGYSSGVVSSAITLSHSPTARLGFGIIIAEVRVVLCVPCICMQPVSLLLTTNFEIDMESSSSISELQSEEVAHDSSCTRALLS